VVRIEHLSAARKNPWSFVPPHRELLVLTDRRRCTAETPSTVLVVMPWEKSRARESLVVLVFIDTLADAVLLAINSLLFCFGEMAVVSGHVFFLAILDAGFALLQIAGLFRV
jgi:hypothetical protein